MSRRIFCKILLVIVTVFTVFFLSTVLSAQGNSDNAFERVKQVQEKHTARLMAIKGVVGTAVGLDPDDRPDVKVFVEGPEVAGIPKKLDEVPVDVVITGKIYALKPTAKPPPAPSIDPKAWFARPVPIGVSTGNEGEISSGTIGCRVTDGANVYALSNNHVYALENNASIGSKVLQPGRYDTAGYAYDAKNVIGTLYAFEGIVFYNSTNPPDPIPTNIIDAAIAISSTDNLGKATPSNGYGTPKSSTVSASVGMQVQKYGRTTALTKGKIYAINATVNVGYSSGTACFVNQIWVYSNKPFIKAGDSGSLLVTNPGKNPVGLLFAGDSSGKWAVANRIDLVLSAFGVSVDGE
jgi:hypothetical protein